MILVKIQSAFVIFTTQKYISRKFGLVLKVFFFRGKTLAVSATRHWPDQIRLGLARDGLIWPRPGLPNQAASGHLIVSVLDLTIPATSAGHNLL